MTFMIHEDCYTQYWYVRIYVVFGSKYTDALWKTKNKTDRETERETMLKEKYFT